MSRTGATPRAPRPDIVLGVGDEAGVVPAGCVVTVVHARCCGSPCRALSGRRQRADRTKVPQAGTNDHAWRRIGMLAPWSPAPAAGLRFRVLGAVEAPGPTAWRCDSATGSAWCWRCCSCTRARRYRSGASPRRSGVTTSRRIRPAQQTNVPAAPAAHRARRREPGWRAPPRPGGYRLHVAHGALDAAEFERLVTDARALAATDPSTATECLERALGLWHGPAYEDVAEHEFARLEAVRLDELRRNAEEDHADALLACGRAGDAVARLEAFVTVEPANGRTLLMRALYDAGRHTDALQVYERHRRHLAADLGVDPSPTLRELERAVLDHTLESSARRSTAVGRRWRSTAPVTEAITHVAPAPRRCR